MTIRIYIGNLPQGFNPKEFDKILKTVSDSVKFKAVLPCLDKYVKEIVSIPAGWWVSKKDRKHIISCIKIIIVFCKKI